MEKKRLFQILDEMNVADAENNTHLVAVCPNLVAADYSAKIHGTKVTMGVPGNIALALEKELLPILVLVNRTEYDKILNETT